MKEKGQPRVLLKNDRYETYQLAATADNGAETAENQLIIAALTVLKWIRTKLDKFEIPEAFRAPDPDQYQSVRVGDLQSAHIEVGYTAEIVCIPEERIWTFRLTEPDMTTRIENGAEVSAAVPGRIFETNIAFRAIDSTLHCAVCLYVSEPETIDGSHRAAVLRPAVVQALVENPKLGLRSGYPLKKQLWELSSKKKLTQLREYLQTGMLPAAVFCEYQPETSAAKPSALFLRPEDCSPSALLQSQTVWFSRTEILDAPSRSLLSETPPTADSPKKRKPEIPYDTALFASARLGYLHSFRLPVGLFKEFSRVFQIPAENGDILFLEPRELGEGGHQRFPYQKEAAEKNFRDLMELSRDYLCRKHVSFGSVPFLPHAKTLLFQSLQRATPNLEEALRLSEQRAEALQEDYEEQLAVQNQKIEQQASKIARLKNQLAEVRRQNEAELAAAKEETLQAQRQTEFLQEHIDYLKSLQQRPKTPQEIPQWVKSRFQGRLELHEKAVNLIRAVKPNEVDLWLLCDALEYLAHEYRDQKAHLLTRDEANARSSRKYDRPFEVKSTGSISVQMYPLEYKIKYKTGFRGKPVETALDEHLKVGNTAGNLIRIYFLYDEERKCIVVGSLPKHLSVPKIQG